MSPTGDASESESGRCLARDVLYACSLLDSPTQSSTSSSADLSRNLSSGVSSADLSSGVSSTDLSSGVSLSLSHSESPSREKVLRSTLLSHRRRVSFAPVQSSLTLRKWTHLLHCITP